MRFMDEIPALSSQMIPSDLLQKNPKEIHNVNQTMQNRNLFFKRTDASCSQILIKYLKTYLLQRQKKQYIMIIIFSIALPWYQTFFSQTGCDHLQEGSWWTQSESYRPIQSELFSDFISEALSIYLTNLFFSHCKLLQYFIYISTHTSKTYQSKFHYF